MTTATLSHLETTVLRTLAGGTDEINTAAKLHVPVSTVCAIQQRFGPDVDRIRQMLDADELDRMPAPPTPIRKTPPPPQQDNRPVNALLDQAKQHSSQRIVKKAERIRQLLDELEADIKAEAEAEKKRRREQIERETALAEIAALEQKLAAARAKIKNPAKQAPMRAAVQQQNAWLDNRGVTLGEVLRWARENGGIQMRGSLLSNRTRKAWDEAHPPKDAA